MKKAFSLKKRLPKVLAVALAAACFAGAVPANAAGENRAYSTIGSYGSFEEYMWRLSDNTSGDILSFNAENQPVVTKGTGATGTEGTSLASRRIALSAGDYQLSFAVKASSQAYYIAGGYGFDSAGSPKEIEYTNIHEGSIGTEWTTVTADFTVPEGYTSNEFRLFLRGNSGEQITVKDLDVKAIEEKATPDSMVPTNESTLEGWEEYGNDTTPDYCNIELSDTQADDIGSVHFKKDFTQSAGTSLGISQVIRGASVEEGKTYTLELNVKGTFAGPHDKFYIGFPWTFATWADATGDNFAITSDYVDWTNLKYDFTVTRKADTPIKLWAGGYVSVDCYIDNIKVYAKDDASKTNLIANGDFCEKEAVVSDSSAIDNSPYAVQNIPGFDIGMLNNEKLEGNKELSVVPGGSYDGSTAVQFKVVHTGSDADKAERYFQQNDGVKFVLGDTSIKATGYFKVTEGNTEPKIWLGFGKKYNNKDSVGLHFAEYLSGKQANGESFTDIGDGWYYFEKTVDTSTFNNMIKSLSELVYVKYMCGIDAKKNAGTALFDNVTCEIVSSAKPGDTNNDGDIDIRDLVHMKKYAAGTVKFTDMTRGTWLSDIGCNESPSITNEMVCMRKYLIGASSEYGK